MGNQLLLISCEHQVSAFNDMNIIFYGFVCYTPLGLACTVSAHGDVRYFVGHIISFCMSFNMQWNFACHIGFHIIISYNHFMYHIIGLFISEIMPHFISNITCQYFGCWVKIMSCSLDQYPLWVLEISSTQARKQARKTSTHLDHPLGQGCRGGSKSTTFSTTLSCMIHNSCQRRLRERAGLHVLSKVCQTFPTIIMDIFCEEPGLWGWFNICLLILQLENACIVYMM